MIGVLVGCLGALGVVVGLKVTGVLAGWGVFWVVCVVGVLLAWAGVGFRQEVYGGMVLVGVEVLGEGLVLVVLVGCVLVVLVVLVVPVLVELVVEVVWLARSSGPSPPPATCPWHLTLPVCPTFP